MDSLKVVWCQLMHDDIAYGGGRSYWCRRCLRRFTVPWLPAADTKQEPAPVAAVKGPNFAASKAIAA